MTCVVINLLKNYCLRWKATRIRGKKIKRRGWLYRKFQSSANETQHLIDSSLSPGKPWQKNSPSNVCPCPNSWFLCICYWVWQRGVTIADRIKVASQPTWKWGDKSVLSQDAQHNHSVHISRKGRQSGRPRQGTAQQILTPCCWLWRRKKKDISKNMCAASREQKKQGYWLSSEAPEGAQAWWHLHFYPVKPIQDFWPPELAANFPSFKPQSLWSVITAARERNTALSLAWPGVVAFLKSQPKT